MTTAFNQDKKDTSYLKLDDALPETIITMLTTRAKSACFTSGKLSKHKVCPQGTCDTWHRFGVLIKETAAYDFIGYYVSLYQHAGRYQPVQKMCR